MQLNLIFLALMLFVASAFAQQQQQPDPKEMNAIVAQIAMQRNQALDGVAVLQAKLTAAEEKIRELEKQLKEKEGKEKSK